ncbi:MAG: leucyl aminopeptidase family protein, partial [Thermoleophilaceae bacterium]
TLKRLCVTHEDTPGGGRRRVIIAGLGNEDDFSAEKARVAAGAAATRAKEIGAEALSWAAPEKDGAVTGIIEGTTLALYAFDRFKSSRDEDDDSSGIKSLEVVGGDEGEATTARITASAQNAARDLQNMPSNLCTPEDLAARTREIADAHDAVSVETFGRDQIAEMGMGAFTAVAQGADTEPQLIVLRYQGSGGPHLGFVGKAVTFDTGGISIKPAAKMHEMKFDMTGGAVVIEAIDAIAALGLPAQITAVVAATENMPSGHAVKPGDIVTAMTGKTIEVNNTDAEGRLILADALCYAREQGVERIADFATLTGAIVVALGHTYAGLFSNDDDWYGVVEEAGRETGEEGWRLPLHPEYAESIKGKYGDIANLGEAGAAGSIAGAEFLKHFVGDTPWVHVDIAGMAWGMKRNYVGSGASGFGVRLMIELARSARGQTP